MVQPKNGRSGNLIKLLACLVLATIGVAAFAAYTLRPTNPQFVTWEGIGPDKWASIWLIRRHVDPEAVITFQPSGSAVEKGIPFDIPNAELSRSAAVTAFEKVQNRYGITDPAVVQLAEMINQIEIFGWQVKEFTATKQVEAAFRLLQFRFGREQVPFGCYMSFFDTLSAALSNPDNDLALMAPEQLLPGENCDLSTDSPSAREALVPELSAYLLLKRIARGDSVVFVDSREDDEYATGHIPGAVNLKLREVDEQSAEQFADADLVVPYCVKDFRGFEVARALQKVGVERVAIMNPYGIRGWKNLGLPLTSGMVGTEATAKLDNCVKDVEQCLHRP